MRTTENAPAWKNWTQLAIRWSPLNGRLSRSVAIVATGHAAGYAILFLTTPVLTRLYNPSDFGLLATYASIMSLLGTSICLRYDAAIPIPRESDEAKNLALAALFFSVVGGLVAAVVFHFLQPMLVGYGNLSQLAPYAGLLAANLAAFGCFQIFTYIATREQHFARLAQLRMVLVLGTVVTQLAFGWIATGPRGLVIGQFVGYLAGVVFMGIVSRGFFLGLISPRSLLRTLFQYRRFPIYGTWSEILHISQTVVPPILLAATYGTECAGWFLLAWRIVGAPLTFLVVPIARVFFAEASRITATNQVELLSFFSRTLRKCIVVALPLVVLIAITATSIFPLLFGEQWEESGRYSQILCPLLLCHLLAISVRSIFDVTNRQDLQLISSLAGCLLMLAGVLLPSALGASPVVAISTLSACSCASYLLSIGLCRHAINAPSTVHPTESDR